MLQKIKHIELAISLPFANYITCPRDTLVPLKVVTDKMIVKFPSSLGYNMLIYSTRHSVFNRVNSIISQYP